MRTCRNEARDVHIKALASSATDVTSKLSFTLTPKTYAKAADYPISISRSSTPRLITRIANKLHVDETGTITSFTLELSKPPLAGGDVTIKCTSADKDEVVIKTPLDGIVILSAADNHGAKAVQLQGVPDAVADGDQSFDVVCMVTSNQDDLKGVGTTIVGINEDIDQAEILIKHTPGAFTS